MRGLLFTALGLVISVSAQEIRLTPVTSGIAAATDIQNAGDGSGRLFLVQQDGIIRILRGGVLSAVPFLDIRTKTFAQGERGLLGLAFPAGFAQKQRFFVDYTDLRGDITIAQYRTTADPDVADPASEVVLLKIAHPIENHNGGQLRFGPDGYLYIGTGDGGSGGDPLGNGQNPATLLGKILRIDVESDPGRVRIPPGNPFVSTPGARGEIWAWGLRNPWRFSFDRMTRDLWIGDVGQDAWEEVDFQPAASGGGENYGWNRMEGTHCYTAGCDPRGLTLPVAEYSHTDGCSIIGGFVYRGWTFPALRGTYFYSDLCSGHIWGLVRQGSGWASRLLLTTGFGVTTFGEDEAGEIYVANGNTGTIQRIDGTQAVCTYAVSPGSAGAAADGGNGFTFTVRTSANCSWAVTTSPWLKSLPESGTGNGIVSYSVYPNHSANPRTGTISVANASFTVTQDPATGTVEQRFVRLLYFNFFGRLPSQSEIDFQVNYGVIPQGRARVATSLFGSDEFNLGARFVAGLYVGILGRDAEYGGWLFQRDSMARNIVNPLGLVSNFLGSPEYSLKYGAPDNAAFVRILYQDVLLRQPAQSEVDFQVNNGVIPFGRAQVAQNFLYSAEYQNLAGPRLTAFLLYACLLQRDPTPAELTAVAAQVAAGSSLLSLVSNFTASAEFNAVIQ